MAGLTSGERNKEEESFSSIDKRLTDVTRHRNSAEAQSQKKIGESFFHVEKPVEMRDDRVK